MEKPEKEKQQQQQRSNPMSMPPTPWGSNDPWLVFFHGKREQNQSFYSILEGHNHVKNIPCLRRKSICTSSYGWMVLNDSYSGECFLLNPTTMEKIQLPPVDFRSNVCVLSLSPVDPSCTVLYISCSGDDVITFRFCSPKKSDTVDHWIKQEVKFEDDGIRDATSCDGKIYGIMQMTYDILIVEVVNKTSLKFRKLKMECSPSLLEGPIHRVLVESCSELYLVWMVYLEEYRPYEVQDFQVMKLDLSRKAWERVESLGNRAFFLGPDCCTSCFASAKESEPGIMENTIYFTMEGDRSLFAFNLEEKSINVSLPCPNVQHNWSQPNWFLPCLTYNYMVSELGFLGGLRAKP